MPSLARRNVHSLGVTWLRVVAALVLGASGLAAAGCPGDLDPRLLATGTGGTGGTGGPQVCDAVTLMAQKCGQAGCHNPNSPQAGLDLASTGVIARLLGQPSRPDLNTLCATNTKALLVQGSNPATGFLLDKLVNPPVCGAVMPQIPGPLSATDMQCMQEWSTAVTTGQIH